MENNRLNQTREEYIPQLLQKSGASVGVEVGVFKGHFSKALLEGWDGNLFLVDPWRSVDESDYLDATNNRHHESPLQDTVDSIKGHEDRAIMIRAFSHQAAHLFPDNSLDFVYVDGNHAYEYVKEDLETWWPKLKSGGFMCGHDYLLIDWNSSSNIPGSKNKYIFADGENWIAKPRIDGNEEVRYAGVFGVNPAVDEFIQLRGLRMDLTDDWNSSYIIKKP